MDVELLQLLPVEDASKTLIKESARSSDYLDEVVEDRRKRKLDETVSYKYNYVLVIYLVGVK